LFWSGDGGLQYVNLIASNGFTTIENTSLQNDIIGNGLEIGLGGCGLSLSTSNICIQIRENNAPPPVPEPTTVALLLIAVIGLA
jgi:hypothetical protein